MKTERFKIIVAFTILTLGLNVVSATSITEVGDAGNLPNTSYDATGHRMPLDSIYGTLEEIAIGYDVDMFKIFISDPANFSAIANPMGTHLSVDNDAQLFVFDAFGNCVAEDDDGGHDYLPAIYRGELLGNLPGVYYIAISLYNVDPADDPISSWAGSPYPSQWGPYQIDFTGVTIPEPATVALLGLGCVTLLRGRYRHQQ